MAVLVTGGAGYIGSHTLVELLNQHYEVVVMDNFSNSSPKSLDRVMEITGKTFPIYNVDLRDTQGMDKMFSENEFDAVIHFAGLKAVGESVENPAMYYENNVVGTLNLCNVMEKYGVNNIVFSSSATVYGVAEQMPLTEESPTGALNPYGRTKLMLEEILSDLAMSNSSLRVTLLRYFNPVGAHASGKIGENPNGIPNNLMPFVTQVAVGKREKLSVFGGDYETEDGTGVRDFIHVVDLAKGHVLALEKISDFNNVNIYNLGTGNGYSVLELIHAFERASGKKIPFEIVNRRPGDIAICYADTQKVKNELEWVAEKGLEEMCADSWNWQRKNPEGFKTEKVLSLV